MFIISSSVCPGQAFSARTYLSEAPFVCSTLGWAPCLIHKRSTWLERLAWNRRSSFLRIFVNYTRKKFLKTGPEAVLNTMKTYWSRLSPSSSIGWQQPQLKKHPFNLKSGKQRWLHFRWQLTIQFCTLVRYPGLICPSKAGADHSGATLGVE